MIWTSHFFGHLSVIFRGGPFTERDDKPYYWRSQSHVYGSSLILCFEVKGGHGTIMIEL